MSEHAYDKERHNDPVQRDWTRKKPIFPLNDNSSEFLARLKSPPPKKKAKVKVAHVESPSTTIWRQTEGRCVYCGLFVPENGRTDDHVVPKSNGGHRIVSNLVPACQPCNGRRGTHWPPSSLAHPDFVAYVKAKEDAQPLPKRPAKIVVVAAPKPDVPLTETKIARRTVAPKVLAFMEDGHVVARDSGIHVVKSGRDVASISWHEIGRAFNHHFIPHES